MFVVVWDYLPADCRPVLIDKAKAKSIAHQVALAPTTHDFIH